MSFPKQVLSTFSALALVAGVASAGGSAMTLELAQPDYAPFEDVLLTVQGQPGQFGFLLFDSDPTPTTLLPGLTVDIGFSASYFATPVLLPVSGAFDFNYSYDCVRSGVLASVGGMIHVQAVSLDPVDASLCTSNSVVFDATDSYGYCKPCDDCQGGLIAMTLRYSGTAPGFVEATKAGDLSEVYFAGNLQPFDTLSFVGVGADLLLASDVDLLVDGVVVETVHTSCSQPIGPGEEFGAFRVLEATSKDGGNVCTYVPSGCEIGKPRKLEFVYTGLDCSASDNSQDATKATCSGDPALAASVHILATGEKGTMFDGVVSLGGAFWLDPTLYGGTKFSSNVDVLISDTAGNLLQTLKFHASCSEPLFVGDVFGSMELVTFVH